MRRTRGNLCNYFLFTINDANAFNNEVLSFIDYSLKRKGVYVCKICIFQSIEFWR